MFKVQCSTSPLHIFNFEPRTWNRVRGDVMFTILGALLSIFVLHTSLHAADKIRIGFPDLAATFVSLAVGEKRGFFQEQGIQAEFIRINPAIALQAVVGGEIDYY